MLDQIVLFTTDFIIPGFIGFLTIFGKFFDSVYAGFFSIGRFFVLIICLTFFFGSLSALLGLVGTAVKMGGKNK